MVRIRLFNFLLINLKTGGSSNVQKNVEMLFIVINALTYNLLVHRHAIKTERNK